MVGEAVVDEIARTEARRKERARHATVLFAFPLGSGARPGRREDACERAGLHRREATEGRRSFLPLDELGFTQDRQLRQVRARADALGIDVLKEPGERRRVRLGVRDLPGQPREQCLLAYSRIARLKRVVEGSLLFVHWHGHRASVDALPGRSLETSATLLTYSLLLILGKSRRPESRDAPSRQPALAAAVVLDVAVALAAAGGEAEVEFLDVVVGAQP